MNFSATVEIIGINPFVEPPESVLSAIFEQAGRTKSPIPVRGRINGAAFVQTLVRFKGRWRLYINGPMLKGTGLKVGDRADMEIDFDPRPRETPVPPEFSKALRADSVARREFGKLTPSRQKEILRYLGNLKTEEFRKRNIERVLKHLRGEETDALHAVMRKGKGEK